MTTTTMCCGLCGVYAPSEKMITKSAGGGYLAIVCACHADASDHLEKLAKIMSDERHYKNAGSWDDGDQFSKTRQIADMLRAAGPGAKPGITPTPVGRFEASARAAIAKAEVHSNDR